MDWQTLSEIAVGKVLQGKVGADVVNPADLIDPYPQILKLAREGLSIDEIGEKSSFYATDVAMTAASRANGSAFDYVKLLERSALRARVGKKLAPLVKKLEKGEDADIAKLQNLVAQFELGYSDFTPMSDVKPTKNIWLPTGYKPIDDYVGGLPRDALTIIGGAPGTGKTSMLSRLLINAAKSGKRVAFFSLEMTLATLMMRFIDLEPKLSEAAKGRILATEDDYTTEEVYAAAAQACARHPDLAFIGIDYADLMVEGEEKTSAASHIYRSMAKLAKRLKKPIVLLSQLNDQYIGGLPKVHHIRWTRLAEATARLILLLYNPDQIWADQGQDSKSNPLGRQSAIIVGKSSYGYKRGGTGAITVEWNPKKGWGDKTTGIGWVQL